MPALPGTGGYEFLATELERIVRDATLGRCCADKLVKVFLTDGQETWLFIPLKVWDLGREWAALEQHRNPFAVVVMAHLKAHHVRDGLEHKRRAYGLSARAV
jgi:hypothetical protein